MCLAADADLSVLDGIELDIFMLAGGSKLVMRCDMDYAQSAALRGFAGGA